MDTKTESISTILEGFEKDIERSRARTKKFLSQLEPVLFGPEGEFAKIDRRKALAKKAKEAETQDKQPQGQPATKEEPPQGAAIFLQRGDRKNLTDAFKGVKVDGSLKRIVINSVMDQLKAMDVAILEATHSSVTIQTKAIVDDLKKAGANSQQIKALLGALGQWANTQDFPKIKIAKTKIPTRRAKAKKAAVEPEPAPPAAEKKPEPEPAPAAAEKKEPLDKDAILRDLRGRMNSTLSGSRTRVNLVPEKLRDVILQSVKEKLDAGEKKISKSDIFTGLDPKVLSDTEKKRANTMDEKELEKLGNKQLNRILRILKMANIEVVNKGQEIDEDILSVIQKLSGDQEALRRAYSLSVDRNIANTSVRARGEEIKVAGATPSTSTKKKPLAKDLKAKIKKAETLEDLEALVPDDEKRITVLRARDDRRGEIKKAQGEEIKVAGATLTVKKDEPDEVRVAKPEDKKEFEEAAEEAAEEVVPSKETEDKIEKTSTPVEELAPEEKEQVKKSIKPEDVTVLIDSKTVEELYKDLVAHYKANNREFQTGAQGEESRVKFMKAIKDTIRTLVDPKNKKIPREVVRDNFIKFGKLPYVEEMVQIFNRALNASLDGEEKEVEDKPDFMARLDAILGGGPSKDADNVKEIPALEPALQETKTVQDYINESHEDKFNKLLKAFTK